MARKQSGQVVEVKGKQGRRFAVRFRAYGKRHYVTLDDAASKAEAEAELANILADVRRGIWQPAKPEPAVEPESEPTFHEFATDWFEARKIGWSERTVEDYGWALSDHLLPYFQHHLLSQITVEEVDRYKHAKLREAKLSPGSINKTLKRLAQVLDLAVEYERIARNPAARRRCKEPSPRRASMGAEQVAALLHAAGPHRPLLATAIMAGGLRVSEVTALRWRDVNLADGLLTVRGTKTDAADRVVELDPGLREELTTYRAESKPTSQDAYVFPGREGKRRDRHAVRQRVLYPAIKRANAQLAERGLPTIPDGSDGQPRVTFHSLRRTYASLCAEANADPAWTAAQIGHADPRFTLKVYTDVRNRKHGHASRVGDLIRSSDWAEVGRNDADEALDAEAARLLDPEETAH